MPKITYTDSSGTARTVEAELGSTVMETAIRNNIPGIEAECGGACACATCHVYVDEAWREKVGGPSPMEEDMLDFGYDVRPSGARSSQRRASWMVENVLSRRPGRNMVPTLRKNSSFPVEPVKMAIGPGVPCPLRDLA